MFSLQRPINAAFVCASAVLIGLQTAGHTRRLHLARSVSRRRTEGEEADASQAVPAVL